LGGNYPITPLDCGPEYHPRTENNSLHFIVIVWHHKWQ